MAAESKNNFGAVRLRLQDVSRSLTDTLADMVAEIARANAEGHKDTGFYQLNIYALHGGESGVPSHNAVMTDRNGQQVQRRAAAIAGVRVDESAVVAAADYSIYLEMKHADLYRATEAARSQFPQAVNKVRKDFNLGDI